MPDRPDKFRPGNMRERRLSRFAPKWRKWYSTSRWQRLRERQLSQNPLCVTCLSVGVTEPATDVDHIRPHRGDPLLFWDAKNLQSLCKACHSEKTARGE